MKMGVYAYKNILDGTVFYVGRQSYSVALEQYGYQRAEDFESTSRNIDCLNYIKNIGSENIEIIWLYETKDVSEKLFPNEFKDKNIKCISPEKRDAYKRTIGWYYIKV